MWVVYFLFYNENSISSFRTELVTIIVEHLYDNFKEFLEIQWTGKFFFFHNFYNTHHWRFDCLFVCHSIPFAWLIWNDTGKKTRIALHILDWTPTMTKHFKKEVSRYQATGFLVWSLNYLWFASLAFYVNFSTVRKIKIIALRAHENTIEEQKSVMEKEQI